ncbi:MAG: DUF4232 domain-containing protein [Streptosporangiaceae bacterium]
MTLRTRAARRIAAAVVIACAAVGLPAVALAAAGSPSHPAVPRCTDANTLVWLALAPNGAAGTIYYPVEFTNVGSANCVLFGYPGVSAVTKSAAQLGPAAGRYPATRHNVTLKPGQTAHALLGIVDAGVIAHCNQATGAGLKVYPPNQRGFQFVFSFTFPACKNKVFMRVYPVTPGIGVP